MFVCIFEFADFIFLYNVVYKFFYNQVRAEFCWMILHLMESNKQPIVAWLRISILFILINRLYLQPMKPWLELVWIPGMFLQMIYHIKNLVWKLFFDRLLQNLDLLSAFKFIG